MAMNPALRCGHCGFDFDPPLENCHIQVGGGTGYDATDPEVHYIGKGGAGVRVTDPVYGVIHNCGEPETGHTGRTFKADAIWSDGVAMVTDGNDNLVLHTEGDWNDPTWEA